MPNPMRRKTILIFCLLFALLASLAGIIMQEALREQLGENYYIISLSLIGCILVVLAGYVWDRSLVLKLRELGSVARTQADAIQPSDTLETTDEGLDEVIGLARQIERMAQSLQKVEANYRAIVEDQIDLICRYRADGKLTFVNV